MKSPIVLGAVADNDTGLILVSATVNPDAQIEVIQVMYVLNQNPKISIQWVVGSSLGGDIRLPTIMGVHNGRP